MWTIQWKDSEPHAVHNLAELGKTLDELALAHGSTKPILVQLRSPAGELMLVGLYDQKIVLDHIAKGGWPAKHSLGDASLEGTIPFMMGTYESEMPKSYAIPRDIARRAVDHFFQFGLLLPEVTWEDD